LLDHWDAFLAEYEEQFQHRHHHVVFTLPKVLRVYFRYDRSLLNGLSRAAYTAILT